LTLVELASWTAWDLDICPCAAASPLGQVEKPDLKIWCLFLDSMERISAREHDIRVFPG